MSQIKQKDDNYAFRPVVSADLHLLSSWLKEPLVSRWYEDPEYVDKLEKHLADSRIRMQMVLFEETPIAFVQDYDIHAWADHHLSYLPKNSRGIDTFIGSDALIGRGHGTKYLTLLSQRLFNDGVPALGIDPNPKNISARRAYKKVGFTYEGEVESQWGRVMLMSLFAPRAFPTL